MGREAGHRCRGVEIRSSLWKQSPANTVEVFEHLRLTAGIAATCSGER
jgi:hypothetical protein